MGMIGFALGAFAFAALVFGLCVYSSSMSTKK
jgi:Flp pilus assembly protein TadG